MSDPDESYAQAMLKAMREYSDQARALEATVKAGSEDVKAYVDESITSLRTDVHGSVMYIGNELWELRRRFDKSEDERPARQAENDRRTERSFYVSIATLAIVVLFGAIVLSRYL